MKHSKINPKRLKRVFYASIVTFILAIVSMFTMPLGDDLVRKIMIFTFFAVWIIFFLLGIVLVVFTLKSKVKGKLKVFLLLTGYSSMGFLVGVILHNLFYGIGVAFEHIIILKSLMEILHVVFFILAIIVCPIVFLIGAIGSIVLFKKRHK